MGPESRCAHGTNSQMDSDRHQAHHPLGNKVRLVYVQPGIEGDGKLLGWRPEVDQKSRFSMDSYGTPLRHPLNLRCVDLPDHGGGRFFNDFSWLDHCLSFDGLAVLACILKRG